MSTTTYQVAGMTCGHCASSVVEEINKIEGVTGVTVDVPAGRVEVFSAAPPPQSAVRDAIEEAGYQLTS